MVSIGMSMCHKDDKFDCNKALVLARLRTKNFIEEYKIKNKLVLCNNPFNPKYQMFKPVETLLYQFIERCRRYYKNKPIIMPNIKFI